MEDLFCLLIIRSKGKGWLIDWASYEHSSCIFNAGSWTMVFLIRFTKFLVILARCRPMVRGTSAQVISPILVICMDRYTDIKFSDRGGPLRHWAIPFAHQPSWDAELHENIKKRCFNRISDARSSSDHYSHRAHILFYARIAAHAVLPCSPNFHYAKGWTLA